MIKINVPEPNLIAQIDVKFELELYNENPTKDVIQKMTSIIEEMFMEELLNSICDENELKKLKIKVKPIIKGDA